MSPYRPCDMIATIIMSHLSLRTSPTNSFIFLSVSSKVRSSPGRTQNPNFLNKWSNFWTSLSLPLLSSSS